LLLLQQETLREGKRRGDRDSGAEQGNAKFAQGGKVLGQARFGELKDFTSGLLGKIGLPDHRLLEACPYTLHPSPCVLNTTPCTVRPKP
jgi:hypothetical protein